MVSVAHIVKKITEDHQFIQEAISRGIINYGALAEELLPAIEKEIGSKVKHAAVMMALRRAGEKTEKKIKEYQRFERPEDITIKSNLFIIHLAKNTSTTDFVKNIYKIVDIEDDVLTITTGIHEISITCNMKYYQKIRSAFDDTEKRNIRKVIKNIASLSIKIPETATGFPGVYYNILRSLAWENINILEVVSTYTELTLLLPEDSVTKAYNIIRK